MTSIASKFSVGGQPVSYFTHLLFFPCGPRHKDADLLKNSAVQPEVRVQLLVNQANHLKCLSCTPM